jgi:deoxyribodipyrimidine photo-lyase
MTMTTAIWWVRRDLRLFDNPALHTALDRAAQVIPVFVLDPLLLESDYTGEKRRAFLFGGLRALDAALRERGSRLIIRAGAPVDVLAALVQETGAAAVVAEADHSPYAVARDAGVGEALPLELVDGVTVHPPGSVFKADGSPYVVFTPFSKVWKSLDRPRRGDLIPIPDQIETPDGIASDGVPDAPALPENVPFPPGELEARRRLAAFTSGSNPPVYHYKAERDLMGRDSTSRLSPYLRFGMLSSREAAAIASEMIDAAPDKTAAKSAVAFLNELIWREFYVHILAHYPDVRRAAFRPELRDIPWENNDADFAAWCEGRTGYPVVDAAMRQLVQTGWMHNRARMIVASFLTKDLLINWQWGERFFMQHLIDGDPASNNGGWQWAAGTGTDAAPYFRIFNPVLQGKKHDPDGAYVRRWVPELANVPDKYLQEPWQMPDAVQQQAGCRIGVDYPAPIVDHHAARDRTLAAYKVAKEDA